MVAVLIIAIGIAVPQLLGHRGGNGRTPAGAPDGSDVSAQAPDSGSDSTTLPVSTRLTAPLVQPSSAPPSGEALTVAKNWAHAWVNHPAGMTTTQWLDGLRPYTAEEYLASRMATVDPANVPATAVTGDPVVVSSYTSSVQVVIPTDGPKLSITLSKTDAGWRVSEYDQAS